jgi:predicted nucleic acid-binding Zn ribbon protein
MERIGDEVQRELTRRGSRDGVPLAALTEAWPGVVGETIARRAWPLRIGRDRTLHVTTESATWANELALMRDEILERLTAQLGNDAPAGLRFAVGPVPEPASAPPTPEPVAAPPQAPPEIESEAASATETIEDPELRELVARAARASLLKARSGRHFW